MGKSLYSIKQSNYITIVGKILREKKLFLQILQLECHPQKFPQNFGHVNTIALAFHKTFFCEMLTSYLSANSFLSQKVSGYTERPGLNVAWDEAICLYVA